MFAPCSAMNGDTMTYKQLLTVIAKCERLYSKAGYRSDAVTGKEYKKALDTLVNENFHSLAILLENYHFEGARTYVKGMFQ